MAISDYSTDPDQNVKISGINIAEGCAPSGINNAIRQLMADVKEEQEAREAADAAATGSVLGRVKLSDSTSSSSAASAGVAATPKAVKAAYDRASTAITNAATALAAAEEAKAAAENITVPVTSVNGMTGDVTVGTVRTVNGVSADAAGAVSTMPDYSAGVTYTLGSPAPKTGFLFLSVDGGYGGSVNDAVFAIQNSSGAELYAYQYGTSYYDFRLYVIPLSKGEKLVKKSGSYYSYTATFFPVKGA